MCFSLLMLIPALVDWSSRSNGAAYIFLGCSLFTAVTGVLLWFSMRNYRRDLIARDGVLLGPLVWIWLPLLASLPILITLYHMDIPINFTRAYFEAVASITTTGSSVLGNSDLLPLSVTFWRTLLAWLGGFGIIILAVAILPLLGAGAAQLFRVEMAGPVKDSKLTPRISSTAKGLWGIYVLFTMLCALSYWLASMPPLDAIMYAFTTIALGGPPPHLESVGNFNNPAIELVAIIFMLLCSCNFTLYFVSIHRRSLKFFWRDTEAQATISILLGSGLFISLLLWLKGTYPLTEALRNGMFNAISLGTTAGYPSSDFAQWPAFAPIFMLLLSGIATSAGSTGAGIKMIRVLILFKQTQREIRRMIHPRAVQPLMLAGKVVPDSAIFSVLAFILVYGATVNLLSFILLLSDLDVITAFSAVLASVHCMGVGLGSTVGAAGSFGNLNDFQIWVCSFAMLLGRLEMLCFLAILMPSFWKK